jgi:UDP-N-acetylmuramate--alanine ligase
VELEFVPDKNQIAAQIAAKLNPGDIVLTLGAGDIYKAGDALVETLR